MALTVDSFDLLSREIFSLFSSVRDGLAYIGALYVATKTIRLAICSYTVIKTHVISRFVPVDLAKHFGRWAVVTGCTGGIGQAYCLELAARGLNIVLISRSAAKLEKLSTFIEENYHVQTIQIAADFNEGQAVYDTIKKGLEGIEVGILVNNVGVMYEYPMYFLQVSEEKLWQIFHVNIAAATMMTHIVLPQMVQRRKGAIVFMASGASSMPAPMIAVYSASKAYLDYFSKALSYEYKPMGITIQCLQPFYIATRMTQYSTTLSKPSIYIPLAPTFARQALMTLGWADRTTGYWPHTVQYWLVMLIPERLWMWGAVRLNKAFKRQAETRIRHRSGSRPRSRPASQLLYDSPVRDPPCLVPMNNGTRDPLVFPSSSSKESLVLPTSASREQLVMPSTTTGRDHSDILPSSNSKNGNAPTV